MSPCTNGEVSKALPRHAQRLASPLLPPATHPVLAGSVRMRRAAASRRSASGARGWWRTSSSAASSSSSATAATVCTRAHRRQQRARRAGLTLARGWRAAEARSWSLAIDLVSARNIPENLPGFHHSSLCAPPAALSRPPPPAPLASASRLARLCGAARRGAQARLTCCNARRVMCLSAIRTDVQPDDAPGSPSTHSTIPPLHASHVRPRPHARPPPWRPRAHSSAPSLTPPSRRAGHDAADVGGDAAAA